MKHLSALMGFLPLLILVLAPSGTSVEPGIFSKSIISYVVVIVLALLNTFFQYSTKRDSNSKFAAVLFTLVISILSASVL